MSTHELLAFGVVVTTAYAVQTVVGFGAMVVCITLGALILPIEVLPAIMVPLSLAQNAWIAVRYRDEVRVRLILTMLLPVMIVGMGIGFAVSEMVRGPALRIAFGALVLVLSCRELYLCFAKETAPRAPLGVVPRTAALIGAGILHGIYAAGGPLLVYAVGRLDLGKAAFRATLTTMWLLLNLVLTVMMVAAGRVDGPSLLQTALFLPAIPVGIVLGELLHRRVDEKRFRTVLFTMLALAATVLVVH